MDEAKSMKTDRAVAYSRTSGRITVNTSAVTPTKPSVVSKKVLVGLHVPIDVNFDHSEDNEPRRKKTEENKRYVRSANTDLNEKKNGKTLVVIALMTIFLFLLAGLTIKFTDKVGNTSLAALIGSNTQVSPPDANAAPQAIADDTLGSLSDILSTRISLISSKNPKFIVTQEGKKIVPRDVIDGSLTVVDIFADHIVVTSNGSNLKIAY